jgi:Leucine-rich repeat (LRR) protein
MKEHVLLVGIFFLAGTIAQAQSFDSLEQALRAPEKVTHLRLDRYDPNLKHLPSQIGSLVNLRQLVISCQEQLEALPNEIGNLKKLERLIIDNGNGCQMNVTIPPSIGQLERLRVLRLYGALDPREIGSRKPVPPSRIKELPDTIAQLQHLEELDLGRNGLHVIPRGVASLKQLRKLGLDYNTIHEIPAFIGDLKSLRELSIRSNGGVKLPQSLAELKGLKLFLGNNSLKVADQKRLRSLYPQAVFDFRNEYDDASANERFAK